MCKLADVIRYTILSQNFHFFAVLERWLIYDCETECSVVYLITKVVNRQTNARHVITCLEDVKGERSNGNSCYICVGVYVVSVDRWSNDKSDVRQAYDIRGAFWVSRIRACSCPPTEKLHV